MKNNKIIYSFKVATALVEQGFKPVDTRRNFKDITKYVWFFEDTPELQAALAELISK